MILLKTATYVGPAHNSSAHEGGWAYIAIHNTSNDATAREEASYARRRTDDVSTHIVVDSTEALQTLTLDRNAWHSGSAWGNSKAISFELRGKNTWSADYWRTVIDRVAPVIAECCVLYAIPVRHLTVEEARKKVMKGFVTHDDMRQAWGGTTHTDPGPNFPMQYLLDTVNKEITGMTESQTDQHVRATAYRLDGLIKMLPVIDNHVNNAEEPNALSDMIRHIDIATAESVVHLRALRELGSRELDYDLLAKALLRNMAAV
jgi:N-acetyl-anhydromuramyl-L-alanine amidase AmpD